MESCGIPAEMVEKILLNLPVKSLLRFSSVSKSWFSRVFDSSFIKKYHGREIIVFNSISSDHVNDVSSCPLSSILSDNSFEDATDVVCPFGQQPTSQPWIKAFCDQLWCVEKDNSFFLWNPSMRAYRNIPNPKIPPRTQTPNSEFVYGLGYDSICDDYKILKIRRCCGMSNEAELYSLRSDSWSTIQSFPQNSIFSSFGSFLNGALHYIVRRSRTVHVLISFDLSAEKYGEVALPEYSPTLDFFDRVEVAVSSGKLCLCLSYGSTNCLALWVMEDYGVFESWTNKFHIDCNSFPNLGMNYTWRPLYFSENGKILIDVSTLVEEGSGIFMYEDGKTLLRKKHGCNGSRCRPISDVFVCVESLVSPARLHKY
ncbi:hypothetical protein C2S51_015952 [Perilla frutescens var. frutescens]|nr:hypothetical protein C2S51_015952 [Perilla frutescens var. frutescens]